MNNLVIPSELKDPYVSLGFNVEGHDLTVLVKLDTEGVVIDVYMGKDAEEPIASTWRLYHEMEEGDEQKT